MSQLLLFHTTALVSQLHNHLRRVLFVDGQASTVGRSRGFHFAAGHRGGYHLRLDKDHEFVEIHHPAVVAVESFPYRVHFVFGQGDVDVLEHFLKLPFCHGAVAFPVKLRKRRLEPCGGGCGTNIQNGGTNTKW